MDLDTMPFKDKDKQKQASKESKRKERVRLDTKKKKSTRRIRIKTADDVTRVLCDAAHKIRQMDCDDLSKGRALALVCGVILKAVEMGRAAEREGDAESAQMAPVFVYPVKEIEKEEAKGE